MRRPTGVTSAAYRTLERIVREGASFRTHRRVRQSMRGGTCALKTEKMSRGSVHIKSFRVQNFRRLKNVRVDLDKKTTIFVGANNSGKTSATHVFQRFLDPKVRFQIYDFAADCWEEFSNFDPVNGNADLELPKIYFDLWFEVDDDNVHRVLDLLPGLDWNGEPVGLRMVYAPKDPSSLVVNYQQACGERKLPQGNSNAAYKPWPMDLMDYLSKRLTSEYEIKYYVLSRIECFWGRRES
jgi:hypothetical protein